MSVSDLPAINATLNGIATILLLAGYYFIRSGNREIHQKCMISAFCCSCLFLVFYVTHKILVRGVHTPFGGTGTLKTAYYLMLFSHIVLAIVIVPMALTTLRRARRGDFINHKRIARITWPLWMYVSVTGVLIYFMLYHWFPAPRVS